MRRCARTFRLLLDGSVLVRWACGAERVITGESAVDVEILADHISTHHRHHHHLLHKELP